MFAADGQAQRRRVPDHRGRVTRDGAYGRHGLRADPGNQSIYEQLYREYVRLHDYFGRGENDVMRTLKRMRAAARGERTPS